MRPKETQRAQPSGGTKGGPSLWKLLIWIPILVIVVTTTALAAGYTTGLSARQATQVAQLDQRTQEQFALGIDDLQAARYELARQRFEYILNLDPDFPGAAELLAESLKGLNQPTATLSPTPEQSTSTPTPTVDTGSFEGLFQSAQAAIGRQDWSGALDALLALRARNPSYRYAEANDLMFSALRNRGLQHILAGEQEQGLYDFSLAERIHPLDNQAQAWRNSAAFYLLANSFIGLNWGQAVDYFSSLCGAGIWDSCFKYALSEHEFGDEFVKATDYCAAIIHYQNSLVTRNDSALYPTATKAMELCLTATASTPTPTPTGTPGTITPVGTLATDTPTATAGAVTVSPTSTSVAPTATSTTAPAPSPTPTLTPSPIDTSSAP